MVAKLLRVLAEKGDMKVFVGKSDMEEIGLIEVCWTDPENSDGVDKHGEQYLEIGA
jgi:hypothetical protein